MIYHLERAGGTSACGVKAKCLVDAVLRVNCSRCRRAAGLEPLPEVAIEVAPRPPRDVLLVDLIELLCEAEPGERAGLCEEALGRLK